MDNYHIIEEGDTCYVEEERTRYSLIERMKAFTIDVYDLCDDFPKTASGRNVANQLCRSASSVGANFRSAWRGRSDKEYIAKLGISVEEADEAAYWLEIIQARSSWSQFHEKSSELAKQANSFTAILVSMIKRKRNAMNKK